MTHLLFTLLLVSVPFFLLFGLACEFWNDHDRQGAVGYAAVMIVATIVWQGAWAVTG